MGLDLDAILPRLSRVRSTVLVALVATGLVFVGRFVFDAEAAVTSSVLFLTSLATSWAAISMVMYWRTNGKFSQKDLHAFSSQTSGGSYWFTGGWNLKLVIAWLAGSTAGILGISSVDYVGPLAEAFSGVDVSVPAAAIVAIAGLLVTGSLSRQK
jgi:cytosine/uracil/thiamine/allantoin permease